jgi:hypothetical protein
VYERFNRVGKKILATGNGACNLSNADLDLSFFHSNSPEHVKKIVEGYNPLAFFDELGLLTKTKQGRIYPLTMSASSVLDVLRLALDRFGIEVVYEQQITDIDSMKNSDAIIIATGGKSAQKLGSDGSGMELLRKAGHNIIPPAPALVPIKLKNPLTALQGCRFDVNITAEKHTERGEILFTAYGVSGIAVMQLSRLSHKKILVDFMPDYSENEVYKLIENRKNNDLTGIVSSRLAQVVTKGTTDKTVIAKRLKAFELITDGTLGFEDSQATMGGADLSQFDYCLQSKKQNGLFACGEVLDVLGDCGGYNLHWAWASGMAAGEGAVRYVFGL